METNNVSPEKKSSILNTLAIAGFVAIVMLLAWLSIQLVQLFPSAFSSLASLAEGINQASETMVEDGEMEPIVVTSNTSLLRTGETLDINWSAASARGSYVFMYDCAEGVAMNQIEANVERQLDCGTNYNVGDITSLTVAIESEKDRFTDVTYSVAFLATNDTKPQALGTDVVTVINETVDGFAFTTDPEELANEEVVSEPETPVTTPTPGAPSAPVFEQQFVYEIPTSNPNGFVDLGTAYIATGEIIGGRFVSGPVATSNGGAIQFEVKNYGTKTSNDWTFSVSLPTGSMYSSPTQVELKPNERAVITIGFPAGNYSTVHTFEVEVDEATDRNSANDKFVQRVTFAN